MTTWRTASIIIVLVVCFGSQSWAMSIQDYYLSRQGFAPLESGDSRILLDATLTTSAAATAAGFAIAGTGNVFDGNGWNGKGTGWLRIIGWANSASMAARGTIYMEIERRALSFDESNYLDGTFNTFRDSVGTDNGAVRAAFFIYNDAATYSRKLHNDGAGANGLIAINKANAVQQFPILTNYNSHAIPVYQDAQFSRIVWTYNGADYYVWVDGHLIYKGTSAALPTTDDFKNIIVGAGSTAGATPLGDFYIRRVQLSTAFIPPVLAGPRVGLYGDSFVRQMGSNTPVPATETVTDIDGVQQFKILTTRSAALVRAEGQTPWGIGLQALAQTLLGFNFPMYTAAKGGSGYEKTPIPVVFRTALNAFRPELIIAMASVNDVVPGSPVTNIVNNTKLVMDDFIDGNPALRKILLIVGISGHRDPTKAADPLYLPEYKRVSALLVSGLDNYRNVVEVVDVYGAWGGDAYSPTQTIGSAPTNASASAGNDIHPSATGTTAITSILWPHVRDFLISRPSR